MSDSGTSSHSATNLQRGMACSNCRSAMVCVPVAINAECALQDQDIPTPAQMRETIKTLKFRVEDLEGTTTPDTDDTNDFEVHIPFESHERRRTMIQEPPSEMIGKLVDTFLDGFTNSGYFFLQPLNFFSSALLPLPFGHVDRPSPSLLSTVYLWGSVLSPAMPTDLYSEDVFLLSALKNLPADIRGFSIHPKLILDTIQAEVLLSLYYLHAGLPVQGRYHAAGAASLALTAGLHTVRAGSQHEPYPKFPLAEELITPQFDETHRRERFDAFWSVVILNNFWVASHGGPSTIPPGLGIDIPWPSGTRTGATIATFLDGDEEDGYSPVALLTKASILLERIISLTGNPPIDVNVFNTLDGRLYGFQSALPPSSGDRTLFMTHALTDLAIMSLHSRHARTSETARYKCLAAAGRVVSNVGSFDFSEPAHRAHPMLGPLFTNVWAVYTDELSALRGGHPSPAARAQYHEIEQRLGSLVNAMHITLEIINSADRAFGNFVQQDIAITRKIVLGPS
ncbi:hypothetical protein C8R44DRAFT_728980 [Mycena epipterygia]|nr:hypothetical protein C8R44DRAFT_728980 [Mycena epipterygia]